MNCLLSAEDFPEDAPRSEHESRGGDFGNTHLSNRQVVETGGEDTVEIDIGMQWTVGTEFFDLLEAAKLKAQEQGALTRLMHGGEILAVFPRGWASGRGQGVYFDYRVDVAGISLSFARQSFPTKQRANVRLDIGAITLMRLRGLRGAWAHALRIVEALGGAVLWNRISRIDLCADLPEKRAADIAELVRTGHTVSRVKRKRYYEVGDSWTGVGIAPGSAIHLRVYDKAREVYKDKVDPEKARLLEELRWGGSVDEAMRAELQLRRAALAAFGINTVEDYFAQRSGLVLNLTSRWFRLTVAPPDRDNNNTQRTKTHADWANIVAHFLAWMEPVTVPAERIPPRPFLWPERDAAQALGFLLRVMAYEKSGELFDGSEIRDCLHAALEKILKISDAELVTRYESKALLVVVQVM